MILSQRWIRADFWEGGATKFFCDKEKRVFQWKGWRQFSESVRSGPGEPNQRKVSSWTFRRGIPEQKFNLNRACFPKEKQQNSQERAKFIWTFRFGPFFGFGLPGRLLNQAFGKDLRRKGNSVKRFGPFNKTHCRLSPKQAGTKSLQIVPFLGDWFWGASVSPLP